MATVRKRTWTTSKGKEKTAWIADYFDQDGVRRQQTFPKKKEADDWLAQARVQIKEGIHTPDSKSVTVIEAARSWFEQCKRRVTKGDLVLSTERQYRSHVDHIEKSSIGKVKLSRLTKPMVTKFRDELQNNGVSQATTRKILSTLKTIISAAQDDGLVVQNVAVDVKCGRRGKRKIEEGHDFPTMQEMHKILEHAGKWRPLLVTAAFTGLRASELRGLMWGDIDFETNTLHVRRRADQQRNLGNPKSAAGTREVPLVEVVVNALRAHQQDLRKSLGESPVYVFPNSRGRIAFHSVIQGRGFRPVQVAAGIIGENDRPKYGLHALRHFFASWIIGLRQYSTKEVQDMLGHATAAMTLDTYTGLFKKNEAEERKDREKLEEGARPFLRVVAA